MNTYLIGLLIGIMIYSFLLTILFFYKDQSSYYTTDTIDFLFAGPIAWMIGIILFFVIRPVYFVIHKKGKLKSRIYQPKSQTYIKKVVKKIIKIYKQKHCHNDYFDFRYSTGSEYGEYAGWDTLLVKKPRYETINRKFTKLMYWQTEDTIKELLTYCIRVTEEMMKQDNCDPYYIRQYKEKELYKIKDGKETI